MKKLFLLVLFMTYSLFATDHYVDKNANGTNGGTSWTNAWESFSDINWGSVNPGDIIYVSGGTDSTVYDTDGGGGGNAILSVLNIQGTAENRITIRNSWDAGHNGRAILEATGTIPTRDCIYMGGNNSYSTDYITIYGLELRGGRYNFFIQYKAHSIILDSLSSYGWTNQGFHTASDDPDNMSNILIQNSNWISPPLGGGDCITFNGSSNHIIRNNFLHMRNSQYQNIHADGILAILSEGFRIYNNIIIVDSNAQGQSYIVRAWADGANEDSVIVYNNFMYQGGTWNSSDFNETSVLNLRWQDAGGQVKPPTFVAHNTVVSWGPYADAVVHEVPATFVNNVFAQFGDGTGGGKWMSFIKLSNSNYADSIRENLVWREYEGATGYNLFRGTIYGNETSATDFGWSTFINTLGGTGKNEDPDFDLDFSGRISDQANMDGELTGVSPCISAGEDLQTKITSMGLPWVYCGTRIVGTLGVPNGAARPTSSTPTIGAYDVKDSGEGGKPLWGTDGKFWGNDSIKIWGVEQ